MAANNNNLKEEDNKIDTQSQTGKPKGGAGFPGGNYKKLIAAGAVAILAIIGFATASTKDGKEPDKKPGQETTVDGKEAGILEDEFEVDAYPKVNQLVQDYFDAYAAGDVDAIEKIAYPITETEKSYIQLYSKYVEKYEDVKCYTKKGVSDGEYLLSVECSTKFKDIKTSVPGLEFFYVRTDKDGEVYIDNAYGQFNESYKENKTDVEISRLKTAYNQNDDVLELLEEVQSNYEKALKDDEALNTMVTDTIQNAIREWVSNVGIKADSNKDDEKGKESETSERTAYTTTKVNLRQKRSISSEVIKTLKKDSQITVSGKSENGWLKADYKGKKGYIKEDYITFKKPGSDSDKDKDKDKDKDSDKSDKSKDSKDTGKDSEKDSKDKDKDDKNKDKDSKDKDDDKPKEEEKRTGYAKTKVNMRKSRSTSSKILKTLKAGTKITVYGKVSGSWYKVSYSGKTGYIHKDYVVFDKSKVKKKKSSGNRNSSSPSYFPEGKSITLTQTVNVRASMSESADLVGLAYQGDVVTVIMSYAEGWTKVSWNDQTGYVKTDVLK